VKVAIYRITQEALNNVAKHAGASQVWVTLTCKPGALDLEIRDDGRGFDPADVSTDRLGLGIMRERAEAIGAALTVDARPGAGTHIVVAWRGEAPSPEETPESSQ
jgi:signal transduction histidine kinase